jgi:hypothetical protein
VSRAGLCLALVLTLGCAPIDVNTQVTVRPREAPLQQFGSEQLADRDYVASYVQLGPRLLVELREHDSCVAVRHVPVMRVEEIRRTNRGFVIWDFTLGAAAGGFAALAFVKPQLFSSRLVDGQGRIVYDSTSGYIVGGVFATLAAGLIAAGIVNALRSRDETRYAEAFEVELGPAHACASASEQGVPVRERALRLIVDGEIEVEGQTDREGRARFELASWTRPVPASGVVPAVLEIGQRDGTDVEPRVLVLSLRVPFDGMVDAHTGVADTRGGEVAAIEVESQSAPIEGPAPAPAESEAQP